MTGDETERTTTYQLQTWSYRYGEYMWVPGMDAFESPEEAAERAHPNVDSQVLEVVTVTTREVVQDVPARYRPSGTPISAYAFPVIAPAAVTQPVDSPPRSAVARPTRRQ